MSLRLDPRASAAVRGARYLFQFHQTGAHFVKDGKMYRVPRREQIAQARKAGIDYKVAAHDLPLCALEHVASLRQEPGSFRRYDGRWSGYVRKYERKLRLIHRKP